MGREKTRRRPVQQSKMPKCKKCGGRDFRKIGLQPTNPQASSKGWHGPNHERYHKEAMARLFHKRYACKRCGTKMNYGNAGRPLM